MISLSYPRTTDRQVISLDGWLTAPIGGDGLSLSTITSHRFSEDYLDEYGPRLHHENSVKHLHSEGDLTFDPLRKKIAYTPTSTYPQMVKVMYLPGVEKAFEMGRVDTTLSSLNFYSSMFGVNQLMLKTGQSSYEAWTVQFYRSSGKVYTMKRKTWKRSGQNSTTISFSTETSYYDIMYAFTVPDVDWKLQQTLRSFSTAWSMAMKQAYAPLRVSKSSSSYALITVLFETDFMNTPEGILTNVDLALHKLRIEDDFSLPDEVPFGDLAMEASERLNAVSINLIAFLRDLRNPLDMIPKLKNLRSLKERASNFLAVKYGILPTISDLQKIIAAFRRIAPSLDREGNRVCYAGHSSSTSDGFSTTTVVQRLKLGVAKEDNGLEALEEGLENIGLFPTFQNLWDLIPYSFVIDWFADVGSFLERVDTHLRLIRLNIRYVTTSRKVTVQTTVTPDLTPDTYGWIQRVQYYRWVSDHAPVPPLSLQSSLTDFNHWLEAAALLIQRKH